MIDSSVMQKIGILLVLSKRISVKLRVVASARQVCGKVNQTHYHFASPLTKNTKYLFVHVVKLHFAIFCG
jgi:hypothetical protein